MTQVRHRAEVRIGAVEIGRAVAVVRLGPAIVVIDRRCPERSDTELLQIIQVLLDAAKVASVPAARLLALRRLRIIGQIPIGEAVGHDQVHRIRRRKSRMCRRYPVLELKRRCRGSERAGHANADRLRIGAPRRQPQKSVMPVRHDLRLRDRNTPAGDEEFSAAEMYAVQQEHGRGQTCPPVRRIDFVDTRRGGRIRRRAGRQAVVNAGRTRRCC